MAGLLLEALTPYTQLFLTHIDGRGESTPPVLLSRFTAPDRAANIPEFVNLKPDAIQHIVVNFLDDYNYARVARDEIMTGDLDRAEAAGRKALELNPDSPVALCNMGVVLGRRGRLDEAIEYSTPRWRTTRNTSTCGSIWPRAWPHRTACGSRWHTAGRLCGSTQTCSARPG